MIEGQWPIAAFDPVRQLRVIAATTHGAWLRERVIQAPLSVVWAVAADLEGEVPRWLFADVRSIEVTAAAGADRLVARARGYSGLRARFDVVLRPGWCLMRSRFVLGGMAATDAGDGATRFALLGAVGGAVPGLGYATAPIGRVIGRHALDRLIRRVEQRAG